MYGVGRFGEGHYFRCMIVAVVSGCHTVQLQKKKTLKSPLIRINTRARMDNGDGLNIRHVLS